MNHKSLAFVFSMLAIASCTKENAPTTESSVLPDNSISYVSIPVVSEGLTKAYYIEEPTYWTFTWENNDMFQYFTFFRGNQTNAYERYAYVNKTLSGTVINYSAEDLSVGETLYSFFVQRDLKENEIENDDPTALQMVIPNYQITDKDPELISTSIDLSFTISGLSLDAYTYKANTGGLFNTVPIGNRTVSFNIVGFNSNAEYACKLLSDSGSVDGFVIGSDGAVTVDLAFDDYPDGEKEQYSIFKVYVTKYNGKKVNVDNSQSITVKASRTSTGTTSGGRTTTYQVSNTGHSEAEYSYTVPGDVKPYPIRDAMPSVSKGKLITTTLLRYPEDIANVMTMYMLGSVAEFRIYSKTGVYTSETIEKVEFETSTPCAGYFTYDITSESLAISGYDECKVTSDVSACAYRVPQDKGGIDSIYMVVAPGTYDVDVHVITKDASGNMWDNKFHADNQEITRANCKPFSINLESRSNVRSPYDPDGLGGDDEEGGWDE